MVKTYFSKISQVPKKRNARENFKRRIIAQHLGWYRTTIKGWFWLLIVIFSIVMMYLTLMWVFSAKPDNAFMWCWVFGPIVYTPTIVFLLDSGAKIQRHFLVKKLNKLSEQELKKMLGEGAGYIESSAK